MSSSTVASIQPAKTRLVFLLKEINTLVFESLDPNSSYEQQGNLYIARNQSVLDGEQGLFRIIHEGQEAIITLTRHKNETGQKLEKLLKGVRKEQKGMTFSPNHTVQLPQLPLPFFNGDPRQWRQFWSSFDAAVHSQTIPDIQKLNYLTRVPEEKRYKQC
uniref:Uncharacterized protein n=1 Tax=Onchocerca volvulus TaxID=6282 RepID=A0A8R1TW75_ONCVO